MEKLTKNSLRAHFWMVLTSLIAGGVFYNSFAHLWQSIAVCFGVIFGISFLAFLLFAIPLEKGRLKKSSWRYRWLKFFADGEVGDTINICHLPGLIGTAMVWSIILPIVVVVVIVVGNIVLPICSGEYVKFIGDDICRKKIPWLPEKRIGGEKGFILRLWMLIALVGVVWIFWKIVIPILFSVTNSAKVILTIKAAFYGIVSGILIFIFVWVFAKWQVWTSLKNLLKSIDEKFCIVGKVLDE